MRTKGTCLALAAVLLGLPLPMSFLAAGWPAGSVEAVVVAVEHEAGIASETTRSSTTATVGGRPGVEVSRYTSIRALSEDTTLAVLSNGLTVIVQENHAAPVATVRVFVRNTGSAFEGKNFGAGLSHVLEHVVAGGTTTHRTEKEIARIVDGFGGATNAATSTDMTTFFIDCPAKDVMTAVELMADAMQHVAFDPSEFDRELRVVQRELEDGEVDRERVLWDLLQQTVYTVHPARLPIIGYRDVLGATTRQAIIDYYRERYVPNHQIFVVAGDVETSAVLDQVAKNYAGTPRGRDIYLPLEDEPRQLAPRETVREMEGETYDIALAWPTVKLTDPDLFALDVAAAILGEGESSRLVQHVRDEQQLVLSVGALSDTPHYVAGMFCVMASCRPETSQKAAAAMVGEVDRLREELVGPEELAKAKKQKVVELVLGRQTVAQAAEILGRNYIVANDPLFDKTYIEGIQRVTAEQVRDVARRYFVPDRLNRVVLAPLGGAPKSAKKPASAVNDKIRFLRLPNGLRVLLKRDTRLPVVNLQAFVLGGSLADTVQTAGRSSLVAAMLDRGAAGYSAKQIADMVDSLGAQLSFSAGRFTVSGNLTTLREDFPRAAAVFAECFVHPTFPPQEFANVRRIALGKIAGRANDPRQEVSELFFQNVPANSPYRVIQGGTGESVEKLTVQDVAQYHAQFFVPSNMVVTVFGDVELEAAQALVMKHFGNLPPVNAPPSFVFDQPNAVAKPVVRHKAIDKPTGMVWCGYPTAGILNKHDYAAMVLLDAVMSGGDYPGGWLHRELRGEGLVYAVHAFQITGPAPGYFIIAAQTQPDKTDEVVARIRRNVERAKAGEIREEEFRAAARMVVAWHAQENTTIGEQARQAAIDELFGLGYDNHKTFDARINAITLEDVIAVAQKYLGNSVLVTASPSEGLK